MIILGGHKGITYKAFVLKAKIRYRRIGELDVQERYYWLGVF